MNPHWLLNKVGANYSAYHIRSFVGVLTRHLMEPNKYASWTLLLRLWAPVADKQIFYQEELKHSAEHHCQLLSSVDYHSALILVSRNYHLYQNGVWLADYVS